MVGPPPAAATGRPSIETVRGWLAAVADPEIPVISVLDLGIVRDVRWQDGELLVTITPTYSGCPATGVIRQDIAAALHANGLSRVRIEVQLSPAWTTDWLSAEGRTRLREYGIAPPAAGAVATVDISRLSRRTPRETEVIACPHCSSQRTSLLATFGSTPCKALYRCLDCLNPFDYFKPH